MNFSLSIFLGESFFICATELVIEIIYLAIIVRIDCAIELIEKFESFIQTSKLSKNNRKR